MSSIFGFLIMLGPLVIIHELGHYLFARLFNVKAEAFSVGFGPKIFKKKIGETEWCVSAIPLGGYVKLLGEDPEAKPAPEDAHRTLNSAAPWKRFFIFFGGPLFNFLFAMALFMTILVLGEPHVSNIVGRVVKNSTAEKAGFRSGDRIIEVAGQKVHLFEEIAEKIQESPGKNIDFLVVREGSAESVALNATSQSEPGFSQYGEPMEVGTISGLIPQVREAVVSFSSPQSKAAQLGFKKGDLIVALGSRAIPHFEVLESAFESIPTGTSVDFHIRSRENEPKQGEQAHSVASGASHVITVTKDSTVKTLSDLGLYSTELFIHQVVKDSPAQKAGILAGDRIVQVGDVKVQSFYSLKEAVQSAGEKSGKAVVTWERDGVAMTREIPPNASQTRDPLLKKITTYTIGIIPALELQEPITVKEHVYNPLKLVYLGAERMVSFSYKNFVSIKKMITQEVSVDTLGGPILIGKIAGESLSRGLVVFLTTMSVLSIGLGVLNILPIPVLDGGHLLLLSIEMIRGKALSIRQMEVLQQVGLSLILLLMIVVIKNDLTRLPLFN